MDDRLPSGVEFARNDYAVLSDVHSRHELLGLAGDWMPGPVADRDAMVPPQAPKALAVVPIRTVGGTRTLPRLRLQPDGRRIVPVPRMRHRPLLFRTPVEGEGRRPGSGSVGTSDQ
jgi:hypothetical protein